MNGLEKWWCKGNRVGFLIVCVYTSVDGIQLGDLLHLLPVPDMNFPDLEICEVLDLYAAPWLESRTV